MPKDENFGLRQLFEVLHENDAPDEEAIASQLAFTQVVHEQLTAILTAEPIKGTVEPPFGKEENVPRPEWDRYDAAVDWRRSHCPHPGNVVLRTSEGIICLSCRRKLDLNDLGIGGV